MDDRITEYKIFLNQDEKKLSAVKKGIRTLSILRFLSFSGILVAVFFLPKISVNLTWSLAIVLLVFFLLFVKTFIQKEKEKKFLERLIKIEQDEVLALNEVYEQFDQGAEFSDPGHAYTFDLDIFEKGGLFQFLNRTSTTEGKKRLATLLSTPEEGKTTLLRKQEALNELAGIVRWRNFFAARASGAQLQKIPGEITMNERIDNPSGFLLMIRIFPAINLVLLLCGALSILSWTFFLFSALTSMLLLFTYRKKIDRFYMLFGRQAKILESYIHLFRMIEKQEFRSELLISHKNKLCHEKENASKIIGDLQKILAKFEYRNNLVFALIAEFLFLWDLQCIYWLNKWNCKYGKEAGEWFRVITEIDALSSLANMNYNNPGWVLPVFEDREFCLRAKNLSHPLIKAKKRIGNDFSMNGPGKITIITGANMAGKSTFLRTIGVNMVLAMNGCRVCAAGMTLKPSGIFTNMRTADNLHKDESYFFAELRRLQQMLALIREGRQPLILIDEMLKGTNSEDKLNGSKALVKQLFQLNANGIVATHDLKLTELATVYPGHVFNQCFNITLNNDNLIFDYKLRPGVTTTMNASFLMRKMGITG